MARMVFPAACPACGAHGKFIEFKAEPCGVHADSRERRYGFRCLACKAIVDEIRDAEGRAHRWADGRHVEA